MWWLMWGVALALCCLPLVYELHERSVKRSIVRANCSHSWVFDYAMDDRHFPYRRCTTCGKQETLEQCHRCGKVCRKGEQEIPWEPGGSDGS